jgi:thymus-specific serine protease
MISLEHRFYGESQPTNDMSVENLRYLSSEQALADLASFITYMKTWSPGDFPMTTPPIHLSADLGNGPWVSFGGSYPGSLATWLKSSNPAIVQGTVGSSAPVFSIYDFSQYAQVLIFDVLTLNGQSRFSMCVWLQVVGAALNSTLVGGSQACFDAVAASTTELRARIMATSPLGSDPTLPPALRPCGGKIGGAAGTPATELADLSTYEGAIFGNFQGTVQYNLEGRPPYVSDLCDIMAPGGVASARPLEALANVTSLFAFTESLCVPSNFLEDYIGASQLNQVKFSGPHCGYNCTSNRQWIYQSCNEFG